MEKEKKERDRSRQLKRDGWEEEKALKDGDWLDREKGDGAFDGNDSSHQAIPEKRRKNTAYLLLPRVVNPP